MKWHTTVSRGPVSNSQMYDELNGAPYECIMFAPSGKVYLKVDELVWIDGEGRERNPGDIAFRHHLWGYALVWMAP